MTSHQTRHGEGGRLTISHDDLLQAVSDQVITSDQAERLWQRFRQVSADRPRFDAAHVAYYAGAVIVLGAMGWFLTSAWESLGGIGIALIAAAYGVAFWLAGEALWANGLRTPGGLLFTLAVWMTPLAIYGLERASGFWAQGDPGIYGGYYDWVKGSWLPMEVGTIAAGALAVRARPFAFLTFPIAFALWFMSMDLTPLLYGGNSFSGDERQWVSMWFGLAMMLAAYFADLRSRIRQDFAFWGYLFGVIAFWGGLSLMDGGTELSKAIYCAINVGLIVLSVLLRQRSLLVFGSLGVLGYLGHLARFFDDSVLFPVILTMIGIGIIYLGVLYQRNSQRIAAFAHASLPEAARDLIPPRARM